MQRFNAVAKRGMHSNLLPFIDALLLRAFRFRTRGFMRMQSAEATAAPAPTGRGSLYIHIPFCETLCPFCSFHRVQHQHPQARHYFQSVREEIRHYHAAGFPFSSAYFGGGTPTTEPGELLKTIELLHELFGVREISVETNPRDLRPEILRSLQAAGVTRLSVGVQSFDDRLLRHMQRYSAYGSGAEAFDRLRGAAGMFPTLNVDLIFNLPHQDEISIARDLTLFRTSGANQLSVYPLMSSPGADKRMASNLGAPDRNRLRPLYEVIRTNLREEYIPSSAWCFTKFNPVLTRTGSDEYIVDTDFYVGVGSGAFSYLHGTLYATTFSLDLYQKRIAEGLTGVTVSSPLREIDQMRYALLMKMFGLRLDRDWALRQFGPRFFRRLRGELRTLEWLGAAVRDDRGWRLTDSGMFWLMLMMSAFFESVAKCRQSMRAHIPQELAQHESADPMAIASSGH